EKAYKQYKEVSKVCSKILNGSSESYEQKVQKLHEVYLENQLRLNKKCSQTRRKKYLEKQLISREER
ncbi:MAG: hypothetical protein AABX88_00190, partial [Nanoarchaeota archaeon]